MENDEYPPQVPAGETKRCAWCSAFNPADAVQCHSCKAVFPSVEGELAYQQAAEALMRDGLDKSDRERRRWRLIPGF